MDCFRSGRDCPPELDTVLAGRLCAGGGAPKKSRPSRESAGLVCFGGAASDFGGTRLVGGPERLARGASSWANRSGCGALFI